METLSTHQEYIALQYIKEGIFNIVQYCLGSAAMRVIWALALCCFIMQSATALNWGIQLKGFFGNIKPSQTYMQPEEKMQTQLGLFEVDARLTDLFRRIEENKEDDYYRMMGMFGAAGLVSLVILIVNFKNKCGTLVGMLRSGTALVPRNAGVPPIIRNQAMPVLPLYHNDQI